MRRCDQRFASTRLASRWAGLITLVLLAGVAPALAQDVPPPLEDVPTLLAALEVSTADARLAAVRALDAHARRDAGSLSADVRRAALSRAPATRHALERATGDDDARIRTAARIALVRFGTRSWTSLPATPEVLAGLVSALDDPDPEVRLAALASSVCALDADPADAESLGLAPFALGRVARLCEDRNPDVRSAAARALGELRTLALPATPYLARSARIRSVDHEWDPPADGALLALADVGPAAFLDVVGLVRDPNPRVRAAAVWVLAELGERAAPVLFALCDDPDPLVRGKAAAYLACTAEHAEVRAAAQRILRRRLIDPDRAVRVRAAWGLGALDPRDREAFWVLARVGAEGGDDALEVQNALGGSGGAPGGRAPRVGAPRRPVAGGARLPARAHGLAAGGQRGRIRRLRGWPRGVVGVVSTVGAALASSCGVAGALRSAWTEPFVPAAVPGLAIPSHWAAILTGGAVGLLLGLATWARAPRPEATRTSSAPLGPRDSAPERWEGGA